MASNVQDLTVGRPLRTIMSFTAPILIGNVFQQLYSAVDAIIVGQTLGSDALASVGGTGSIQFLVFSLISGLSQGMTVLTARYVGAGDREKTRDSVTVIYLLGIVTGGLMTVLGIRFLPELLTLLHIPDAIRERAYQYQSIIFAGLFGMLLYNLISSIIRALGDSRTPLYFLILSSILNIFGDLAFILIFHWDVAGAALATVLSQLISGILCLVYGLRHYEEMRILRHPGGIPWKFVWLHIRTGVPISVQNSITGIGIMVFQGVLNAMGTASIAAYTACSKIDSFGNMPMFAIATALVTYTAQNCGAGKTDRIRVGVWQTFLVELVFGFALAAVMLIFCRPLVSLFVGDATEEIYSLSRRYVLGEAVGLWCAALLYVYRAAVQGAGVTTIPMLGGFLELVMRIFAALVLAPHLGMLGLGLASPLAWLAASLLNVACYHRLKARDFEVSPAGKRAEKGKAC